MKRRRNYEYSILRKECNRKSFLKYAVFEKELAKLLSSRVGELGRPSGTALHVVAKSSARVGFIYSRAVHRFPGDAKLWLHYARHCIEQNELRAAARIFSRAIALCGSDERVWLSTMAFHFDTCGDTRGARVVAQRGLRAMPTAISMWLEYFRMELYYVVRLTTRRYAIGLPPGSNEMNLAADQANNVALVTDTPVDQHAQGTSGKRKSGIVKQSEDQSFWNGAVPVVVLKGAFKKAIFRANHRAEVFKIATECPLVPPTLLQDIVKLLQEQYPECFVVGFLATRVEWDMAKAQYDRDVAATQEAKSAVSNQFHQSHEEARVKVATDGVAVLRHLKEFMEREDRGRYPDEVKDALLISVQSLEMSLKAVSRMGTHKEGLRELKQAIKGMEPMESEVQVSGDGAANVEKSWTLKSLERYFKNDYDGPNVPFEDIRNWVKSCCLFPFRAINEDRVLCTYLSKETDMVQLLDVCARLLSLPPVTMGSLCACAEAFMRLFEGTERTNASNWNDRFLVMRKVFVKAGSLGDAKRDVRFWLVYLDFERRVVKDAKEACSVNAKAMRSLEPLLHENFVERQTLQNLR